MVRRRRSQRGSTVAEFGGALVVFVCLFLMPIIDFSFIPVRYLLASGMVNDLANRLALSEKRSDAYGMLDTDNRWHEFLGKCGVVVQEKKLTMIICGAHAGEKLVVAQGDTIPTNWLPGGDRGPCVYTLELSVKADVPPLVHGGGGVPGLTGPIAMGFTSRSHWEQLGRNPQTGAFYVNE